MKTPYRFHCVTTASALTALLVMVSCTGKTENGQEHAQASLIPHENAPSSCGTKT
jgi:hypothetical protein